MTTPLLRHAVAAFNHERQPLLFDYLTLPSVSNTQSAIQETVTFLKHLFDSLDADVQLLNDLGGNPVIYAHFSATHPTTTTKTLLFYNHYDVQPAAPLDEWLSPPFVPTVRESILYARGVADNKGNLMARINAIAYLLETKQELPCNVTFLIEGEEEIGSPNLDAYLSKYHKLFAADACIWEFGGKDENEEFVISAGVKGIAYFELSVETAAVDLHSSLGAIADNASWRLIQALASLRNTTNEVTIPHFYQDISPPTPYEEELVAGTPFNDAFFTSNYHLERPLITHSLPYTPQEALVFYPTLTICGLTSGYQDPGIKTVLPKKASAKVDCRLVKGQTPEKIATYLRSHLEERGFGDVELSLISSEMPFKTDLADNFVKVVLQSAKDSYGEAVRLTPTSPGSGPMALFDKYLAVPILSSGTGWAKSNAHGPNESIRLADFDQGVVHMITLFEAFGTMTPRS